MSWRFKRWDVREDGKVFWQYDPRSKSGQSWVTWEQAIKYYNRNSKSLKEYRQKPESRERKKISDRKYYEANLKTEKYQKAVNRYRKKYQKTEKYRDYQNSYARKRRLLDPIYAMSYRLRSRMHNVLKNKSFNKKSKTASIIGCDWERLVSHIESKFVDGMNWENRNEWHIDHIIPLSSARSEEELIKLSHYTNLQPLWAAENRKKGAKIITQKQ